MSLTGLSLLLPVLLQVQGDPAARAPAPILAGASHGLPGRKAGTERWLVTFKQRGFDLAAFRTAVLARRPAAEVARIVAGLEADVVADQKDFVAFVEGLGGDVVAQWWLVNACAVEVPRKALDAVRRHPRVAFVHADEACEPVAFIKTATNGQNHRTDSVQAQGILGKGVAVAIMDTGLDSAMGSLTRPHRTFFVNGDTTNTSGGGLSGSRMLANNLVKGALAGPDDPHGHGTGVAGIAAGEVWGTTGADKGHAPLASIVGYAIGLNSAGSSDFTIMAQAWQDMAADRTRHNLVAANNSYSGSSDPLNVSQQAMDSAALNADLLPVIAAGNFSSSTASSQSALNGLAVGATNPTTKTMATFSSRGPHASDSRRFYPDLVACGVNTVMPKRDAETADYVGSGTSMASPQVCGAATLFRSVATKATALETKAALLASTEDVSTLNTAAPYNTRNAYGLGFLRVDTLIDIAKAASGTLLASSDVSATNALRTFTMPVQKGKAYAFALAWNRHNLASTAFSDLNLRVKLGTTTLGFNDDPANTYEKVVVLAQAAGVFTIEVAFKGTLDATTVPFALAGIEVPPPFIDGKFATFGDSCKGSGKALGVTEVLPSGYATKFGETNDTNMLGLWASRYQVVLDGTALPAQVGTTAVYLRADDQVLYASGGFQADLELLVGYAGNAPGKLSATYAANVKGTPTSVFKGKLDVPVLAGSNTDLAGFPLKVPFSQAFVFDRKAGPHLLLDFVLGTAPGRWAYVDFVSQAGTPTIGTVVNANSATATTGSALAGFGPVLGLSAPAGFGVPLVFQPGPTTPEIGIPYTMDLSQALAGTAVLHLVGTSDKAWGPVTLPLELGGLGAAGCRIYTSIDLILAGTTDKDGAATLGLTVPKDKALIQLALFHQAAVIDAQANGLGLVTSSAIQALLGGQP
ncbi:MAG: S8 family serine peptidase [Planctomycetota bacterium]